MSRNFAIGELVEVRDANIKTWRDGIITQLKPKLLVKCDGWSPLTFDHVRKCASKPPTHKQPVFTSPEAWTAKSSEKPKKQPILAPPKPKQQPVSAPSEPKAAAPVAKPQSQNLLYYNPSPPVYQPQVRYYYVQPNLPQVTYYQQQYYANTYYQTSSQFYPSYNPGFVPQETQVPQFEPYKREPEPMPTPPEVVEAKIEPKAPVQTILGDTKFELPQWVKPIFPMTKMAS